MNERAVFDTIVGLGTASCSQVSEQTGISKPTVAQAIHSLLAAGVVRVNGRSAGQRGRTGALYAVDATGAYSLSIDVGVGHVRAGVGDLTGAVVARTDREVEFASVPRLLTIVARVVDAALAQADLPRQRVVAAVAGSPGAVDPRRTGLTHVGRMRWLEGVDLGQRLSETLGMSVAVENDVNLAALGEQAMGHCAENMAVLSVGGGVGAALILDGRLFRGPRGAAGEIESVPFGGGSSRPSLSSMSRRSLSTYIALRVSALAAIADVELVVLTGELGVHPSLLEPVRRTVATHLDDPPRIETSSLGTSAVLLGALADAHGQTVDRILTNISRSRSEQTA
ncbi:MAG: ROK family protein [Ilumatobacteraceae bacterium]